MWVVRRAIMAVTMLAVSTATALAAIEGTPPYPPSTEITGIEFDWRTVRRTAVGSDNWAVTWSADGDQYTTWGDGGGFAGGSERIGRVSLGVGRIEGDPRNYRGINIWGGHQPQARAKFNGKSRGILSIGRDLYLWRCGDGSTSRAFRFQRLYKSTNGGRTFSPARWEFPGSLTFYCPAFAQFGPGYTRTRDDFVYMYAAERNGLTWNVHKPGRIMLMRAPRGRLMDRDAYQFFAGRNGDGTPIWTPDVKARRPVFENRGGVRLVAVSYNAGLGRYLLTTEHKRKGEGHMGMFDAPEPWGPWTTVLYEDSWGKGHIAADSFYWTFSTKWFTDGGRGFTMLYTGDSSLDALNTVQGRFKTGGR